MPAVFVHGVPEAAAIWDAMFAQLQRKDVIALSPPGFGAPVPAGFTATSDAYLTWLTEALQSIEGPIDLVGHDWGGGHVLRLAMSRPDLIRSWVSDVGGIFDPEYVWHDMARAWQSPDIGERTVAAMTNAPLSVRTTQLRTLGLRNAADSVATAMDPEMGRCILALYRSAAQPMLKTWGNELPKAAARPGLFIIATEDHYTGGEELARRSAERAGVQTSVLQGLGHWWMCEDPERAARTFDAFFATLP